MSGLAANFAGSTPSMTASLTGELVFGVAGEPGGYYSIHVSQPDASTMRIGFLPSKSTMPSISSVNVLLPKGPKGDPGQADDAQVQELVMEYLRNNPPKVTETDPSVPAWAKEKTKPTYTAAEVGAVSADALENAIADALAQAKVSGEFDGKTPEFSIGTVETLASGSQASASITGTAANPILNLGIPKGDSGEGGGAVSAGSNLRLIRSLTLEENADKVDITTDNDGNPFECHALLVAIEYTSYDDTTFTATLIPNGIWTTGTFSTAAVASTKLSDGWKAKNYSMHYAFPGNPNNVFMGMNFWTPNAKNSGYNDYLSYSNLANRASITSFKFSGKFAAGSRFTLIEVG